MNGFKGRLVFLKNTGSEIESMRGYIGIHTEDAYNRLYKDDTEYVLCGITENISVDFFDTTEKEIQSLEKAIEQERAASQQRINVMLGKIRDLQALEAPSEF